jgi:glycyl-tRNA synthetase
LTAFEPYKEPIVHEVLEYTEIKGGIGKAFNKDAKKVQDYLKALTEEQMKEFQNELTEKKSKEITIEEKSYTITDKMCEFKLTKKIEGGKYYVPNVIEPSFGIGRIIYAILEHAYWVRDDDLKDKKKKAKGDKDIERSVLSLTPEISPFKAAILPLQRDSQFDDHIEKIRKKLTSYGISYRLDDSSVKIGRRYARCDEIGIPFGITIDYDSLTNDDYTLRDRDSCTQIRVKLEDIVKVIQQLVSNETTWDSILKQYPTQKETASEKVGLKE